MRILHLSIFIRVPVVKKPWHKNCDEAGFRVKWYCRIANEFFPCIMYGTIAIVFNRMGQNFICQFLVDFPNTTPEKFSGIFFEFYAGRNWKNRKLLFDEWFDRQGSLNVYASMSIEQIYPLPKGLRLFYHFDFGDNWYFDIRKSRKKPTEPQAGIKYPRVVDKIGPNPRQYGQPSEE